MFLNTFYELCRKNNTYPLTVVKETGIATGSITKWKNGTVPSGAPCRSSPIILPSPSIIFSAEEIKELDDYLNFIISKRSQP